jgi:hypothetical protein
MNSRKAAEVAFGVVGVWFIVGSIPAFPALVFSLTSPSADQSGPLRWLGFFQLGLVLLCGVGLVLLRRRLAAWLVPNVEAVLEGSISGLQAAAYSVIAVLSFAHGLRDLVAQVALAGGGTGDGETWRLYVSPVAQMVVGLALFFGARGLVTIWQALRTMPHDTEPSDRGAA